MPKRSSPRKLKKRSRRRILCSRCGSSYSYSGSRSHSCGDNTISNASSDKEAGFESPIADGIGLEEESDPGESDAGCHEKIDTEPLLSSDFRRRLVDRLRKRFNEEDLAHFDDDDPVAIHVNGTDNVAGESVNENWEGTEDDSDPRDDFDHDQQQEQEITSSSLPFSDKCGVLVYWLLLFLFSWQCGFSVTDSALEMLLKFLSRFFWVLGTFDENSAMALIAKCFPNSLYKLRKHLGLLNKDDFVKYVVCPKCKSLYDYKDCIQSHCGRQVSARCTFVAWSRHPHRRKRGTSLFKVHSQVHHLSELHCSILQLILKMNNQLIKLYIHLCGPLHLIHVSLPPLY